MTAAIPRPSPSYTLGTRSITNQRLMRVKCLVSTVKQFVPKCRHINQLVLLLFARCNMFLMRSGGAIDPLARRSPDYGIVNAGTKLVFG
jgi:hypothetical protein